MFVLKWNSWGTNISIVQAQERYSVVLKRNEKNKTSVPFHLCLPILIKTDNKIAKISKQIQEGKKLSGRCGSVNLLIWSPSSSREIDSYALWTGLHRHFLRPDGFFNSLAAQFLPSVCSVHTSALGLLCCYMLD